MKKIISFLLAAAVAVTSAAALAGCAGTEYPVEIANIQINKEPENIVVLDANNLKHRTIIFLCHNLFPFYNL